MITKVVDQDPFDYLVVKKRDCNATWFVARFLV
jgi:hypothetical protein